MQQNQDPNVSIQPQNEYMETKMRRDTNVYIRNQVYQNSEGLRYIENGQLYL